jgi:antitoxin VapB
MGKEYTARSFKSGNSVAIRMPAGLGVTPGKDWVVSEEDGKLILKAKDMAEARLDVDAFWGKLKGLKLPPREDFDERPSTIARRKAEAKKSKAA